MIHVYICLLWHSTTTTIIKARKASTHAAAVKGVAANRDVSDNSAQLSKQVSLFMIGDSCDRIGIEDWCRYNHGTMLLEKDLQGTNHTASLTVHSIFKAFGRRRLSWEIRVCECHERKIYLTFLANKHGVKPFSPWFAPIRTTAGIESVLSTFHPHNGTLEELFHVALSPAIIPLQKCIGGAPHGVLLNSAFWDLSHPDMEVMRVSHREEWLQSWGRNVSKFMDIVRAAFPHTTRFFWKTANNFSPVAVADWSVGHWNNRYALNLLADMKNLSHSMAKSKGFELIDYEKLSPFPRRLRDNLHPTAEASVPVYEHAVQLLLKG